MFLRSMDMLFEGRVARQHHRLSFFDFDMWLDVRSWHQADLSVTLPWRQLLTQNGLRA